MLAVLELFNSFRNTSQYYTQAEEQKKIRVMGAKGISHSLLLLTVVLLDLAMLMFPVKLLKLSPPLEEPQTSWTIARGPGKVPMECTGSLGCLLKLWRAV